MDPAELKASEVEGAAATGVGTGGDEGAVAAEVVEDGSV